MRINEKYNMSYIRKMGNVQTHEIENELIILLPVGCFWAKKTGGCTYCGYQTLVEEMLSSAEPMSNIDIIKEELAKQTEIIHRISIFVGGSFFEIPAKERHEIMQMLNGHKTIREIYIETRPELITDENIAAIKRAASDKTVSVAIGLESSNDYIRNKIHNKGVTKEVFEKAMKILLSYKIHPLIYVFVKPAVENMTDEEAINDALETINYSFEKGAYMVELECGYIVENSAMYDLYQKGKYTPLTLWSIRELLIKALKQKKGIVRLAYFSDTPKPIAGPYNCDKCSDRFFEMFDLYRRTMDANVLYQEITCTCQTVNVGR